MEKRLKEIFKRMCLIRYFELGVVEAVKKKLVPGPVYLSVGQESISATISTITKGYAVFAQHRCHSVYLAYGGNPERLIDELLGRRTGCCAGRGGSPCIQDLNIPMYGHHGLIGENIPLATGYALATGEPTVAYFGDAASEEDYALTSFGFAATHKLPILYVCEDNNLSILTPVRVRRSWDVCRVTESIGLPGVVIGDEPEQIYKHAKQMVENLPAYIEVKTHRHRWHVGIGIDGPPEYDRLEETRKRVDNSLQIEEETKNYITNLWEERLQKQ